MAHIHESCAGQATSIEMNENANAKLSPGITNLLA